MPEAPRGRAARILLHLQCPHGCRHARRQRSHAYCHRRDSPLGSRTRWLTPDVCHLLRPRSNNVGHHMLEARPRDSILGFFFEHSHNPWGRGDYTDSVHIDALSRLVWLHRAAILGILRPARDDPDGNVRKHRRSSTRQCPRGWRRLIAARDGRRQCQVASSIPHSA